VVETASGFAGRVRQARRDADFFLELLPGIPERNLLPPSINSWKERIEQDELAQQVPVGLLSGPSGCGKSSLMKAGILPRLRPSVTAVYLEATQGDTESRLLSALRAALRKAGRPIPDDFTLVESMEWLASVPTDACSPPAASQPAEAKVLVVIDQFEQWLYARRADSTSVLRDALGQCDGGRLQAILMVRDDYWTPISDFLKTLDIGLLEGENWQRVSLFDLSHARKVLALFGQAYDKLPAIPSPLSSEQTAFLNAAVTSLAEKDKVVSVRLSVFAELMRGRDWTRETLAKVGGADGVGVTFLDESFAARDASPVHKRHAEAAQRVLKSLLPPLGAEIKGHNRSTEDLMAAANYARRPSDFDELTRILSDHRPAKAAACATGAGRARPRARVSIARSLADGKVHLRDSDPRAATIAASRTIPGSASGVDEAARRRPRRRSSSFRRGVGTVGVCARVGPIVLEIGRLGVCDSGTGVGEPRIPAGIAAGAASAGRSAAPGLGTPFQRRDGHGCPASGGRERVRGLRATGDRETSRLADCGDARAVRGALSVSRVGPDGWDCEGTWPHRRATST
jgi:hypothetical protein